MAHPGADLQHRRADCRGHVGRFILTRVHPRGCGGASHLPQLAKIDPQEIASLLEVTHGEPRPDLYLPALVRDPGIVGVEQLHLAGNRRPPAEVALHHLAAVRPLLVCATPTAVQRGDVEVLKHHDLEIASRVHLGAISLQVIADDLDTTCGSAVPVRRLHGGPPIEGEVLAKQRAMTHSNFSTSFRCCGFRQVDERTTWRFGPAAWMSSASLRQKVSQQPQEESEAKSPWWCPRNPARMHRYEKLHAGDVLLVNMLSNHMRAALVHLQGVLDVFVAEAEGALTSVLDPDVEDAIDVNEENCLCGSTLCIDQAREGVTHWRRHHVALLCSCALRPVEALQEAHSGNA
eukprot:CAMPEP_0180511226 /NCGR_PEP_ID=MMETSP1036_2-20121128/50870_1 /TAXON_ID=632150 /ORGANISM="Azadinium spinosum, Strain 3D9" /LENGTH=346 /DNA_ID=CAMNT_0022522141 /DNA_START=71 /DNA_END=1110 /DNA_ORIENTATION=+